MKHGFLGFTLSEVLITLGIIGIVAAITLPSINNNIKNHTLRSQFQKQYRNIYTAINEIEFENGLPYECGQENGVYTITECQTFWEAFFNKFNIVNTCQYTSQNCSPIYKTLTEVKNAGGGSSNQSCSFFGNNSSDYLVYKLPDGAYIIKTQVANSPHQVYFGVDINGEKGPNKWGYDLFYMTIDRRNDKLQLSDSTCALWEKGGRRVQNMLIDDNDVKNNWNTL